MTSVQRKVVALAKFISYWLLLGSSFKVILRHLIEVQDHHEGYLG